MTQPITWSSHKIKISDLKDYENNPRKITKDEFANLVRSLKEDGYHSRLLVNLDNTIIGGHQRKKALLKAGFKEIDEIEVLIPSRLLVEDDFDRINIRDNLPFGGFDFDMLGNLFDPVKLIDWGMPAEWLQIDVEEIPIEEGDNDVSDLPVEPTAKLGDVWLLGEHRLMCGNATSVNDIDKLLDSNPIDMVYTDPPYGCNAVSNDGTIGSSSNKYDKIIGDESNQTAVDAFNLCAAMKIICLIFWGGNFFASALPDSSNWIVWNKDNGTNDFGDCELAWTNQKGAIRMFTHKWNGFLKDSEKGEKRVHPTQKPIELALWCFKEYGKDAQNILDLFGGSGSTLIACEKAKRKCFMMELSPKYCDVIIARWEKLTKQKGILEVI